MTDLPSVGFCKFPGSICVLCCTIFQWLQSLMPIFSGIAAAILGFIFHRPGLIVVGCVWSALLLFITILTWHSWGSDGENACAPESIHRYFPCPEMLQEWAEKWCNLGFQAQVLHRDHSTVMLGISAAIFGAFGSWAQTKTTFFKVPWWLSTRCAVERDAWKMCANVSGTLLHIALIESNTRHFMNLALRSFQGFHSLTITCLTLLTFAMSRILSLQAEGSLGLFEAFNVDLVDLERIRQVL